MAYLVIQTIVRKLELVTSVEQLGDLVLVVGNVQACLEEHVIVADPVIGNGSLDTFVLHVTYVTLTTGESG